MRELPNVAALAAVSEERLQKLWEGLGYYTRARCLRRAAERVVTDYGGELPRTFEELKGLPGIGDYTAAAIASICFGAPEPAVDGNLLRVAARLCACAEDITDARVKRAFRARMAEAIDRQRPGAWNQAMMDLGATVCLPGGAPLCASCPLRSLCEAYRLELTGLLPARAERKPRRGEEHTVFLLLRAGRLAVRRRADRGLLAGLTEFPNAEGSLDEASARAVLARWGLAADTLLPGPSARHIFTHVEWQLKGYTASVSGEAEGFRWVDAAELETLAIPAAFRAYTAAARTLLRQNPTIADNKE